MCVCTFSIYQESTDMILGDEPLIFEVVLSHRFPRWRDSGQTVTRASSQGCLMSPRRIPSLSAANCGLSCLIVLLRAAAACRSTLLLRSPQCHGQAPATSFRVAPPDGSCTHVLPRPPSSPPHPSLCSSGTRARLHALFAAWRMPFHRVAPQHSLPLQRGVDSRLAPKYAASRRVMAAGAVPELPRSQAREHACSAAAPSRHLPFSSSRSPRCFYVIHGYKRRPPLHLICKPHRVHLW
jgi:hypothetical protein